jgi:hypothetical protein
VSDVQVPYGFCMLHMLHAGTIYSAILNSRNVPTRLFQTGKIHGKHLSVGPVLDTEVTRKKQTVLNEKNWGDNGTRFEEISKKIFGSTQ